MKIISGKIQKAQKIVLYGPEGIGKSTFASKFPNPLFLDTEESTKHMDVDRFERPLSWAELITAMNDFKKDHGNYKTIVVDTADWAEILCIRHVCSRYQKNSLEDFGYGKGYTYVQEEFGKFLNFLEGIIDMGINVVVTAHAKMRKFEQPDESGAYDRWELKLSKGVAPMLKEWADMVLFANYKTYLVKDDNDHVKAKGGQRVMYTTHNPCWDAKNRHGLPDECAFDYSVIAPYIPSLKSIEKTVEKPVTVEQKAIEEKINSVIDDTPSEQAIPDNLPKTEDKPCDDNGIPSELQRLMDKYAVTEHDIQTAVANNNYYPADTPIANYDPLFIQGKIIAGWNQFYKAVQYYKSLPFNK